MNHPPETQIGSVYRPSTRQVERNTRLRRFNFLAVYLPLGIAAAAAISLTILLIIIALGIGGPKALATISGVADSVVILAIIPTMVLCAIVPTAFFAITFQMRSRDQAPIRTTQRLLWRVQFRLELLAMQVYNIMAAIREPFIRLGSRYSYVKTLLYRILSLFKRR